MSDPTGDISRSTTGTSVASDQADGKRGEVSCHAISPLNPECVAAELGVSVQCALIMVRHALAENPDSLEGLMRLGSVSVIETPSEAWTDDIALALKALTDAGPASKQFYAVNDALLATARKRLVQARAERGEVAEPRLRPMQAVATKRQADGYVGDLRAAVKEQRAFQAISHDAELFAPEILISADRRVAVKPPTAAVLHELQEAIAREAVLRESIPHPGPLGELPVELEEHAAALTPLLITIARRPGQGALDYLRLLATLLTRQEARKQPTAVRERLTLETLHGTGQAGLWGLRTAADLKAYKAGKLAWSEVDRGIVLVGAPGTGKTSFARALANSAGVPLVAASLAQWQGSGDGHLGHLLGAMRRSFEEARRSAPSVMLIDEIDSFPARSSLRHAQKDYVIAVVNGLLEQLDGSTARDGVLVIGACNDPSNLDPALTRPGRLETMVHIFRPDPEALARIFRVHLGQDLAGTDLSSISEAAAETEAVGADVERWCRGARRTARLAGRNMIADDLVGEIGPGGPPMTKDERRRTAVHEAGHALAWAALGAGVLLSVQLTKRIDMGGYNLVSMNRLFRSSVTRQEVLGHLRALLAGRAAEAAILGEVSGGAGGIQDSDLCRATRIAMLSMTSLGLDEHAEALVYRGGIERLEQHDVLARDPVLRARIASLLNACHADALDLVRRHQAGVERVAEALQERGRLEADEVIALLGFGSRPFGEPGGSEEEPDDGETQGSMESMS